jgi:N-acetylglucosaminyldiphosphoundecaprenol N-acetyl-beta-D-mannosaminyltransferase
VPTFNTLSHRLHALLPRIQRNIVSDYPGVQRLAESCHVTGSTIWLSTLNTAVTRSILLLGEFPQEENDYYCIDGAPIKQLLGKFLPPGVTRVTGTDLVPFLCAELAPDLGPIVFVGENDDVAKASVATLSREHARADLIHVPLREKWRPSDPVSDSEHEFFCQTRPGVVFVCLSHPKTREWFAARKNSLPAGLYIGAGSALRVSGGYLRRLPQPLRDRGFEWVGRLFQDPLRLGPRYAADLFFLFRFAFELSRLPNRGEPRIRP